MTLGPGSWGGSITSDNVTPLHLINIKRLGEEIRPYVDPLRSAASSRAAAPTATRSAASATSTPPATPLAAGEVQRIVDQFLADFRSGRP
jgi:acetaldehyde dehydrogenase (acetylating)